MKLLYLSISILLILLTVHDCLARKKTRKPNAPSKPASRPTKTSTPAKPGELFFKGGRHAIQLNQTEDSEIYAANHTMFPDSLFYPRKITDRDVEEFLVACMNTTLEAGVNSVKLEQIRSNGEVYARVVTRVIEFLCLENYHKEPNRAHLPAGGLWEVLIAVVLSLVLKQMG